MPDAATSGLSALLRERLRLDSELLRHQQIVTVLFADIVGSTPFYERYGDVAGLAMVQKFFDKLAPIIEQHSGTLVKTIGDAILARFEHAEDGAHCALNMQFCLLSHNEDRPLIDQIHARVALNSGLGLVKGNDIFGDVVNVCSRIESVAQPDQILVSPSVYDQICQFEEFAVKKCAEGISLKGKSAKLDLYEVVWRLGETVGPAPPRPDEAQVAMAALPQTPTPAVGGTDVITTGGDPGALNPGTILASRYRIVSLLGRGGMGEVYRAEDLKLGEEVALKFLSRSATAKGGSLDDLYAEVRNARQVAHPNVCRVYDIGEWQERPFIAMEYVDGEDLETLLRRIGRVPQDKALEIALQLCAGVAAAHAKGVLHRDLKPSNVMIDGRGRARITDFGLAIRRDQMLPGEIAGTPAFMAPEQLEGATPKPQTDLYSLGLVLYELFTGKRAFDAEPEARAMVRPLPPSAHVADLHPAVEAAILRCLEADPAARPSSALALGAMLPRVKPRDAVTPARISPTPQVEAGIPDDLTFSPPFEGTRPSSAAIVLAEARRHKWVLASVLLCLAALIGGLGLTLYRLSRSTSRDKAGAGHTLLRLTESGRSGDVAISPDGQYVIYVLRDGERQSLNMRHVATGSDIVVLPADRVALYGLSYSPDGNHIFLLRSSKNNPNYSDLYQIPVLGGTPQLLLHNIDTGVSFSPDGKELAFVRGLPPAQILHLVGARVDGSGEHVLAQLQGSTYFNNMFAPSWSPDGKTIAMTTWETAPHMRAVVSLITVAGGARRELYVSANPIGRPQWLPDGKRLLVPVQDAAHGSHGQIWQISAPGGQATQVTNDLGDYDLCCVSLTRDGAALAVVADSLVSDLWIASSDDLSRVRQVTAGGPAVLALSWITGDSIVYRNSDGDLTQVDMEGNRKLLAGDGGGYSFPSACGRGEKIVYIAFRNEQRNVWRMDADGTNPVQLTHEGLASRAQCSPEGTWVLYVNSDGKAWRQPLEGGAATQLPAQISSRATTISDDGKFVAYIAMPKDSSSPNLLTIIPSEGGPPTRVFELPMGADELHWVPAGNAIDYLLTRGGITNLWRQQLAGGPPRQVTSFDSGLIFHYDWSRDGRRLALARGTPASDIVLISGLR